LPTIKGYELELRMLFQNLITNAIKFCAADRFPIINISCEVNEKGYLFKVKDNGIGIKDKFKERIFVIFQRLHTRETYEGAGISLAHCRKVAELHRDSISIDFKVDVGTTFNISIPYL
jgi:light-regulated signal transduction histidine kinase (bacteriophytochrome)